MTLFAIHQPNFLPWLGYFHKIARVDTFIIFDSVALSNGKSWTSRCQILLNGTPHWLTMHLKTKGRSGQLICAVELQDFAKNWQSILSTIRQAYRRAPHFESVFEVLNAFSNQEFQKLSELNTRLITTISENLGLNHVQFLTASSQPQLMQSEATKTDYILQTCQAFGIQNYFTGRGGSLAFLNISEFEKAHIKINFQDFVHPIYPQLTSQNYVQGLSIVDVLMNLGWEETGNLLDLKIKNNI